jgi:cytoskeleton protein RodZ
VTDPAPAEVAAPAAPVTGSEGLAPAQPPVPEPDAGPGRQLAMAPRGDVGAQPAAGPAPAEVEAEPPAAERAPTPVAELRERLARLQMELGPPVEAEPAAGAEPTPDAGPPAMPPAEPEAAAGSVTPGRIHEVENTDARVVLRALGHSWIRISSLGGDYLRTRTLEPGDLFLVPNRSDLELWTGNAGGVEVILDGTPLAPLGDDGAVVREVPLDPPSLRARFGDPVVR